VVSALDLLPTMLALAGLERPDGLDGMDVWPWLSSPSSPTQERSLFWREQTAEGDALWGRVGDTKYIVASQWDAPKAYDLSASAQENDQTQLSDLSEASEAKSAIESWNSELPPPAWPVYNWRTGKKFSDERASPGGS
jgi:arylsulfatase A-like enzyme